MNEDVFNFIGQESFLSENMVFVGEVFPCYNWGRSRLSFLSKVVHYDWIIIENTKRIELINPKKLIETKDSKRSDKRKQRILNLKKIPKKDEKITWLISRWVKGTGNWRNDWTDRVETDYSWNRLRRCSSRHFPCSTQILREKELDLISTLLNQPTNQSIQNWNLPFHSKDLRFLTTNKRTNETLEYCINSI